MPLQVIKSAKTLLFRGLTDNLLFNVGSCWHNSMIIVQSDFPGTENGLITDVTAFISILD
ncbi:hypothetical protein [Levilactobacillus yiduensis]|uniref:hypothetical protein n=1 Tax=Levilactobacillus yiduensis TaxID=2953880 RepID=UPI000EF30897|nr:hypothetical protein [Levilactobacillus yiduensis]AYM03264.1 hypothetical protein D8911_09745 [Levilactobacillus brevis]